MKEEMDKIKGKLIKLINLSENNAASQGEIDNALAMAAQIMARHNLTREDIAKGSDDATRVEMSRFRMACLNENSTTWENNLIAFCVSFIGNCNYYKSKGVYGLNQTKKATFFYVYGSIEESEMVKELFVEMQEAISMMALIRYSNFYSKDGGAYCEGFVAGLVESNHKQKDQLCNDAVTNALMIVSNNTSVAIQKEAKVWLAREHKVRLSQGQGTRGARGARGARELGKADGRNYGVGKPSVRKKLD